MRFNILSCSQAVRQRTLTPSFHWFESSHDNQKPINIGYLDFFPKGSYSNNYFLIEVNIKCIKIIDNLSLVIKFFRFLLFSCLPFLLRGCGSSLKAAIMGRYPVGGSGPVCKTGAYYARMVRAHLSPPIIMLM